MTKRVVGILLVLALVLGAAARPLSAQAPAAVRVTARTAQIMSRPSAEAEVVLSADAGTVLNVVDTDGQWYWVLLSPDRSGVRRRGWIQARDVQLVSAATVTSPPIPPTAEEMRAMQKSGQVVGSTAAAPTPTDPKPEANRRVERAQLELEKARREYEAAAGQSSSSQSTTSITAPDNAQVANDQRRLFTPPTPRQSLGFRAFGAVDVDALTAQKSFDAVLGTSQLTAFGGGADVLNVWKTAFVRVAVSHATGSGNRAFVLNGQPVSLNIPIKVSMTPVEIGGGWRFLIARAAHIVPYAGGGALIQPYSEKSTFAGPGDDVSQTNLGFTAFGGVEFDVSKWLMVGGEAQFRGVPNALGKGSVSQDFGDTNLGGFALRVLFGIRR